MCKGVKYDLKFKINKTNYLLVQNLKMKEIIKTIQDKMNEIYGIDDIKLNNQIIYNLINRPSTASRLLAGFCKINYN